MKNENLLKSTIIAFCLFISLGWGWSIFKKQTTTISGFAYRGIDITIDANVASYEFDPNPGYNLYRFTVSESSGTTIDMSKISAIKRKPIVIINTSNYDLIFADQNIGYFQNSILNNNDTMTIMYDDANIWVRIDGTNSNTITPNNIYLNNTTYTNQKDIIYKNNNRFIHNFNYSNDFWGRNLFIGEDAGNFTMGSGATPPNQASYNVGVGYAVLYANQSGYYNVGLGSNNSALGANAGQYYTGGGENANPENCLYLGAATKSLDSGQTNEIVIGYTTP